MSQVPAWSTVPAATKMAARQKSGVFRYSRWDGVMVLVTLLQAALVLSFLWVELTWFSGVGMGLVLAFGLWWNSNTISHNNLHNPFFRSRWANRLFSAGLTLLLGVPQVLWKERHLWHHAGEPETWRFRSMRGQKLVEFLLVGALWGLLAWFRPWLFVAVYLPAYGVGLFLCQIQGHFEHAEEDAKGRGISHYSRWYNWFWFNDGFHIEHHLHPRLHWRELPANQVPRDEAQVSSWPPVLRWLAKVGEQVNQKQSSTLGALERLALAHPWIQRWMLRCHRQAFRRLLDGLEKKQYPSSICIVGGGLFPRTLLVLRDLLPDANYTVLDCARENIMQARSYLKEHAMDEERVQFVVESFSWEAVRAYDAVVIPLAFLGHRREFYAKPREVLLFVHDWLWHRFGDRGVWISPWIGKRLNLVVPKRMLPLECGEKSEALEEKEVVSKSAERSEVPAKVACECSVSSVVQKEDVGLCEGGA